MELFIKFCVWTSNQMTSTLNSSLKEKPAEERKKKNENQRQICFVVWETWKSEIQMYLKPTLSMNKSSAIIHWKQKHERLILFSISCLFLIKTTEYLYRKNIAFPETSIKIK